MGNYRFLRCYSGFLTVLLALFSIGASPSVVVAQSSDEKVIADGKEVINLLDKGQFADVAARFNTQMSQAMTADQLAQTWKSLIAQVGAFKGTSDGSMMKVPGVDVALITCTFEKVTLLASVAFDGDKKIAGLRFVPKP